MRDYRTVLFLSALLAVSTVSLTTTGGRSFHEHFLRAVQHATDDSWEDLVNQAVGQQELGNYTEALQLYQQALVNLRKTGDLVNESAILYLTGQVYGQMGKFDKALELFQQALANGRKRGLLINEWVYLNAIGGAQMALGEDEKAAESYQQALDSLVASKDAASLIEGQPILLANLGEIYKRRGKYDKALEYLQQALDKAPSSLVKASLLLAVGAVHAELGHYPKALEFYQQGLAVARQVAYRPLEGPFLASIGFIYDKQGELSKALDLYLQAIKIQESIRAATRLEEFKTSVSEQSVNIYQRASLALLHLGQPSQSFEMAERARARSFLDQLANVDLGPVKGVDPQLAKQEKDLRKQVSSLDQNLRRESASPTAAQKPEQIQALSDQLAASQGAYEDLVTRIKLASPEYATLVSVAPLTLSEVQKLLDENTTLLSYYVTMDQALAFVVTKSALEAVELPVASKDLSAAIAEFRDFGSLREVSPPSLKRLYTWLIAPVKSKLKTPMVAVIPNGPLHYLPFAALGDGQHFFGDDYILFYLPSASVIPFVQRKRKASGETALVLAPGPIEGLPTLRYAEKEARAIASLYKTDALLGKAASEKALKERASSSNILHIVAHGQLNTANPLFSRVMLAPGGGEDGALEVQEVYALDLAKANLVVLSACQTELGAQSLGDDIIGLNRAFMYAGAPTVIASLWSVNDEATTTLMTSFYTHLKQGMGKAAALQAAQSETRAKYPHPYYWASFVLTGDPGVTTAADTSRDH